MKSIFLYISSLSVVVLTFFASCQHKPNTTIAQALLLAEEQPDSALAFLCKIQYKNLSEVEKAKYAVAYTMAQDKSGMDVDKDSLIRIGYNWYEKHPDDSLYAECLYYMGKYYMLNDSIELATYCLERAYKATGRQGKIGLECCALEKLSKVEVFTDDKRGLMHAKMAIDKYERSPKAKEVNRIYLRLNLCESLAFADSFITAIKECRKALYMAERLGDSTVMADTYQDLSNFYSNSGHFSEALQYAKKAYEYRDKDDVSISFVLASAYCDADSLKLARNILDKIHPASYPDLHTKYNIMCKTLIKGHDSQLAIASLDSTNYYLDKLYCEALQSNNTYYASVMQKEKEEARLQGELSAQRSVSMLTFLLALVIISFILFIYDSSKKRAKQQTIMAERIHTEELSHRDIQISTMRNFLLKKIDIMEKIESMRNETEKHILISEDDWSEIEVFLDSVENLFVSRLQERFSSLTKKDLRLMMLLRLKMPQKTLASIYGISEKSIKQKLFLYKAKVGIEKEQYSLREFIETF